MCTIAYVTCRHRVEALTIVRPKRAETLAEVTLRNAPWTEVDDALLIDQWDDPRSFGDRHSLLEARMDLAFFHPALPPIICRNGLAERLKFWMLLPVCAVRRRAAA